MKQNFTPNHLIKYLYKETSASETLAINEALAQDRALLEEYQGLLNAYQQLPKVKFNASSSSIKNILGYSKQTTLEKQA
jgi:hypothetical protein